jgi:hypothetical protein
VGVETRLRDEAAVVAPYARAAYDYDLNHDARSITILTQAAAGPFEAAAFLPGRDAFSLTGGARIRLARNVRVTVTQPAFSGNRTRAAGE